MTEKLSYLKIAALTLLVAIACWLAGDTVRGSAGAAQECEYGVSPTGVDLPGSATSGVIQVNAAPGCA